MKMRWPDGSLFLLFVIQFSVASLLMMIDRAECSDAIKGGRYSSDRRLLVFGDSYADTGNLPRIEIVHSWNEPYGITFPKKPSGRFSDGRVFTDFFASFLGVRSPIPYMLRKYGEKLFRYGMNFAVGGSGVFETLFMITNLTTQIDQMKEQVNLGVINLNSSVALVVVAGNDYIFYQSQGGTIEGLGKFSQKLIHQLKLELKRIRDIGVERVAVANLNKFGCLPAFTRESSYTSCNETANEAAAYHNKLLTEAVLELNKEDRDYPSAAFVVIDFFSGFSSSLRQARKKSIRNFLKPCCEGVSDDYSCGSVGSNGEKKYSLCSDPEEALYWDNLHPTQAAWNSVYHFLKPSLKKMLPCSISFNPV